MSHKLPISVLVVIHSPDGKVLLIERADRPGFWQSVTGSVEPGEPPPQAAARETGEETGIVCRPSDLLDWHLTNRFEIFADWRSRYASGVTHNLEHVFSLRVPEQPVVVAPGEHLAWSWQPWAEAAAACFSWSNRDAILMLGSAIAQPGRL